MRQRLQVRSRANVSNSADRWGSRGGSELRAAVVEHRFHRFIAIVVGLEQALGLAVSSRLKLIDKRMIAGGRRTQAAHAESSSPICMIWRAGRPAWSSKRRAGVSVLVALIAAENAPWLRCPDCPVRFRSCGRRAECARNPPRELCRPASRLQALEAFLGFEDLRGRCPGKARRGRGCGRGSGTFSWGSPPSSASTQSSVAVLAGSHS